MKRGDQPAFPDTMRGAEQSIINQSPHQLPTGLTIREYFASMAMQSILNYGMRNEIPHVFESVALDAVKMADELLKQLES